MTMPRVKSVTSVNKKRELIRAWVGLADQVAERKVLIAETEKLKKEERQLREDIGEAMANGECIQVDGEMFTYAPKERAGTKWESLFRDACEEFPADVRARLEELKEKHANPTVEHRIVRGTKAA